jgi:hypothetical protein|nr:MAG TPA: Nucleotide modification associated domain 1 [Caudoviricetes sp.]
MRCYFSPSVSAVDNEEMTSKENSPKIVELTEEQKERENDAKECIYWTICKELFETYKAKNADYGDSFAQVRDKYPNAILIRLNDKLNRLETLMNGAEQHVNDESVKDTLLDLANYCIMELVERRYG